MSIYIYPVFYSETTLIANYLELDDFPNGRIGDLVFLFPQHIPNEAKSIVYRYSDYKRINGYNIYLEMELPANLFESEKQRITNMFLNDNAIKINEEEGFTVIIKDSVSSYHQAFYYCDEQLKVKYKLWFLGW